MTSKIFYSSLVISVSQTGRKSYYKYVPSFSVEEGFWIQRLLPGMDDAAASFFRSEVIDTKSLFVDWVCNHTNIQGASIPEINFMLTTLYRFGLTDDTPFSQELKAQITNNLISLNFPDYGTLLHELTLTDKPNFIPAEDQKQFINSKLHPDRIYPQKLKLYFDNPIVRLRFCRHALSQPEIAADLDAAVRFYEALVRSSEQGSNHSLDAGLKDILEVALSLVIDYNPLLQPEIDGMIEILKGRLVELRETDLVLFFRLLVLRKVHSSPATGAKLDEFMRQVDSSLSRYKKEPSASILMSVAGIVKHSGLCQSKDIPHLTSLINKQPLKPQSRLSQQLSGSEKQVSEVLERNRIKIVANNPTLLNHYTVDMLLERKVCIEVNGYFHYTSPYIESTTAPSSKTSAIHPITTPAHLDRFRTTEAVKYLSLLKNGYRLVTIDIRRYLTDPRKYEAELISCLQSLK